MAPSKTYSSQEVARLVDRWQFCQFFDMRTLRPLVNISSHDLYRKNSQLKCDPAILENIKAILAKAYAEGVREVGMIAPRVLHIELVDLGLSVTDDPDWKIHPKISPEYLLGVVEAQEKIWTTELASAQLETQLGIMEKEIAETMGFTDNILAELANYTHATSINDLPEHLRSLFAEGAPEAPSEIREEQ